MDTPEKRIFVQQVMQGHAKGIAATYRATNYFPPAEAKRVTITTPDGFHPIGPSFPTRYRNLNPLRSMVIPCITMSGTQPTFHLIPIAMELSEAVATGWYPWNRTQVSRFMAVATGIHVLDSCRHGQHYTTQLLLSRLQRPDLWGFSGRYRFPSYGTALSHDARSRYRTPQMCILRMDHPG